MFIQKHEVCCMLLHSDILCQDFIANDISNVHYKVWVHKGSARVLLARLRRLSPTVEYQMLIRRTPVKRLLFLHKFWTFPQHHELEIPICSSLSVTLSNTEVLLLKPRRVCIARLLGDGLIVSMGDVSFQILTASGKLPHIRYVNSELIPTVSNTTHNLLLCSFATIYQIPRHTMTFTSYTISNQKTLNISGQPFFNICFAFRCSVWLLLEYTWMHKQSPLP